ncbi:MAG: kelch repeat-containing protein, partial [Thermomicrobiales bacterium]
LDDGRVLLLGGWTPDGPSASTELYDPAANQLIPGPAMTTARADPAVALLPDGRLLVAGGDDGDAPQAAAELYDPAIGAFTATGEMTTPRTSHAAIALPDGRVLVAGGMDATGHVVASAEVYDPETGAFAPTGSMAQARYKFGAVALDDGAVLIIAGTDERDAAGALTTTERYNPATGTFSTGPALRYARFKIGGSVAALPDGGGVLVAGGAAHAEVLTSDGSEVISPALGAPYAFLTATTLIDGRVLLTGGYDDEIAVSRRTWHYTPS